MTAPLRIAWLYPRHYWERKMSSVRRHALDAVARDPRVELLISGVGWPDYDVSASVRANLDRLQPGCDLLGWYKPLGEVEDHLRPDQETALIDPLDVDVPRCLRFNEAWWPDDLAAREARSTGSRLVICHHAEDLERFDVFDDFEIEGVHIPHCAEQSIFAPPARADAGRDIDILLCGSLTTRADPGLYPLRLRFRRLIESGAMPGVIRPKPPSMLGGLAEVDAQVADYASALGRSRIVITDGTRHRYPLAKYIEAAMAGALVIGTLPAIPPPGYEDFVVPVDFDMSDAELVETVRYWLDHDTERRERALLGRQLVLERYTQERYADAFITCVARFLGRRPREESDSPARSS